MKTKHIKNEKETEKFAAELEKLLVPGSIVALSGDLGTGKTALTRYIAAALGVKEDITSPTFTIIHEYTSGRIPLYHFDVYRIGDTEEMYELGFEEYFFGNGVCIIEWAELISELIPEDALRINISYGEKPEERIYEYSF